MALVRKIMKVLLPVTIRRAAARSAKKEIQVHFWSH
jgi:hypothetical protein